MLLRPSNSSVLEGEYIHVVKSVGGGGGGGGGISALTGVAEALAKILDLGEQEGQEGERKGEDSDGSEETMTRLWVKT